MDLKLKIVTDITNAFSLLIILGVDFDDNLTDGESIYFSIPEYIKVTKEYIDTEVNMNEMKINLCDYQHTDNLRTICKQLVQECVSKLLLLCLISEPDIATTQEDFELLKECIDEELQNLKFFSKVRTGETWDNNNAINNVKQEQMAIHNVLNKYIGYKKV